MAGKLTPKQLRFVEEYLIDLNATQAYLRAGYRVKLTSARVQACRLLADPSVAEAIQRAKHKRAERTEITQDRVLQELARIAFFDIRKLYREDGTLKKPTELDDETAAALVGIDIQETISGGAGGDAVIVTRKAKVIDRTGALALAMRHLGMLKDKVEHSGEIGLKGFAARMRRRGQGGPA
jgi:phage terminase small subunit